MGKTCEAVCRNCHKPFTYVFNHKHRVYCTHTCTVKFNNKKKTPEELKMVNSYVQEVILPLEKIHMRIGRELHPVIPPESLQFTHISNSWMRKIDKILTGKAIMGAVR